MKQLVLSFLLSLVFQHAFSQKFSGGLAYSYLYSKQLDKAIQSYNFNRPFLVEKQALFTHGLNIEASYLFAKERKLKQGISFSYSNFRSFASNENYEKLFQFHLQNVAYFFHFEHPERFKNFYGELFLGLSSSLLTRKINGEAFVMDDKRARSWGIGGNCGAKVAYYLLKNKNFASFIRINYMPHLFAPKNEALINTSSELVTKRGTSAFNSHIGLIYHL